MFRGNLKVLFLFLTFHGNPRRGRYKYVSASTNSSFRRNLYVPPGSDHRPVACAVDVILDGDVIGFTTKADREKESLPDRSYLLFLPPSILERQEEMAIWTIYLSNFRFYFFSHEPSQVSFQAQSSVIDDTSRLNDNTNDMSVAVHFPLGCEDPFAKDKKEFLSLYGFDDDNEGAAGKAASLLQNCHEFPSEEVNNAHYTCQFDVLVCPNFSRHAVLQIKHPRLGPMGQGYACLGEIFESNAFSQSMFQQQLRRRATSSGSSNSMIGHSSAVLKTTFVVELSEGGKRKGSVSFDLGVKSSAGDELADDELVLDVKEDDGDHEVHKEGGEPMSRGGSSWLRELARQVSSTNRQPDD